MPTAADALPCVGVVLAGGHSRRMGRDKALLPWRGRPLIEHQLALLRAVGVEKVTVSGHRPAYGGIADARDDAGPVAGLAGVAAVRSGDLQLLVIPVDMPLLDAALLRSLRTHASAAACVRFADHVLPLRLRIDARSRAILERLLQRDDPRERSLQALQQAVGMAEIPLADAATRQLVDCNTEAIWQEVNA